jgi:hypothetical protein
MIFEDVLIDRLLENDKIVDGMVQMFSVQADEVWVKLRSDFVLFPESIRILCNLETLGGEFKLEVEIILRDESLVPDDAIALLRRLCGVWQCRMLISDETPTFTARILVSADEKPYPVWLDSRKLDDDEWCLDSRGNPYMR